jgi:hypothetical protein
MYPPRHLVHRRTQENQMQVLDKDEALEKDQMQHKAIKDRNPSPTDQGIVDGLVSMV